MCERVRAWQGVGGTVVVVSAALVGAAMAIAAMIMMTRRPRAGARRRVRQRAHRHKDGARGAVFGGL
ncbi:MAG: hypothetical protein RLZZ157_1476 [Pseudomonadota bacterium]|jgi:hypothetical protein